MVYIFTKFWYPSHKADKVQAVGEKVLKENPIDTESREVVIFAGTARKNGIEGVAISKVKEGKMEQALTNITNIMMGYRNIEGYEFSIEIWADLMEQPT